jgi:hypothetical protein
MLMLVIQHQPDRSPADFGRELVARIALGGFTFSGVGAFGKPRAVHSCQACTLFVNI